MLEDIAVVCDEQQNMSMGAVQGQVVGAILFASNETTAAAAATAAVSLTTNSSAYNLLMTQSATTALDAWLTSNTTATILSGTSYAGLTIPDNFTYTLLNVTNVVVINATVANQTVESLLNITSSSQHYAMELWLNVTVRVGYSVALNSSVTSGRRLLQHGWGPVDGRAELGAGSTALALPGSLQAPGRVWSSDQYNRGKDERILPVDSGQSADSAEHLPALRVQDSNEDWNGLHLSPVAVTAAASAAASRGGGRQLQQSISYSWTSPLDLQLALLTTAFTETSQCNATAIALQLNTTGSLTSLNCTASTSTTLLTNLLATASTGSTSALTVLMVSSSPTSSRTTSTVDNNAGIEASVSSGVSILLQGYEVEIAEVVAMTITAIDTVDELGASMAATYIKEFIATAQNYISVTTTYVEDALVIFGKTVTATTEIEDATAYETLVQTALEEAAEAENTLLASTTFLSAVAALAPNCTTRDSLGNAQFVFLLAANQSLESFSNSSDTAEATNTTAVANETASDCPSALVDAKTGYCVSTWSGYSVTQVSSMPAAEAVGEEVIGRRHVVGFDGNVVVGGLLVHQVTNNTFGLTHFTRHNRCMIGMDLLRCPCNGCPIAACAATPALTLAHGVPAVHTCFRLPADTKPFGHLLSSLDKLHWIGCHACSGHACFLQAGDFLRSGKPAGHH